jgi:competence protein ComEC
MLLIFLSGAWLAGIWLGFYFNVPPALAAIGVIPLIGAFFIRRHRKAAVITGLAVILFAIAAGYAYTSLYGIDESKLRYYNDTGTVEIKGTVAADPDVHDNSMRLTVAAAEINLETGWRTVGGKVLVTAPRYPACSYGDYLDITGNLQTPSGAGDFDYKGYLAHQGIYASLDYPKISVEASGRGSQALAWIYNLRASLSHALAEALPEPQAALAQGIILGIRSNIPADLKNDFAVSGTTHLLAISGMNIGIMAGIILGVSVWAVGRKRKLYVWLTLGAVWVYAVITGLNPPVLRGAIMASAFLAAEMAGRQRSGTTALCLAAAVMAGIQPYALADASFQLSFLAMAGLIFIFPVFQRYTKKWVAGKLGETGGLAAFTSAAADTLGVTLAAILAVWPALAYYFGYVSLAGLPATFLLTPALPLITAAGGLAALTGLAWTAGAQVIGWVAWLFLSYMLVVVKVMAAPAIVTVKIGAMHPAVIAGYYLLLTAALWMVNRRKKNPAAGAAGRMKAGADFGFGLSFDKKLIIASLALVAVVIVYTAAAMPGGDMRVSFLDVGEGDATLIRQGSRQVLVDGGPSPRAITAELGREMPFWDRTIDVLVLTHPHQDHLAGLVEVMRRYNVGMVVYAVSDYQSPMYDEFMRLAGEKGTKTTVARAGERIGLGRGIIITVLNPPETRLTGTESDIDNNSVVLAVSDGAVGFLLTGDIISEGEQELLRERGVAGVTVMKAAHHGSDTSSTAGFLAVADPQAVVISCGEGNRFGHPMADVVKRLQESAGAANVYRTDRDGTIDFTTDGKRLWVKTRK